MFGENCKIQFVKKNMGVLSFPSRYDEKSMAT